MSTLNQQVASLAAMGHKEISVVKLPSQAKRKPRKPTTRRARKVTEAAATSYVQVQPANLDRITASYKRQANADRRAAALDRAAELNGQPIF